MSGIRFVWRVADMMVPPHPGLVVKACSRCAEPAYFDTAQPVVAELADAALVCVPCALRDPEHREYILRMHARVQAATRLELPS